MNNKPLQFEQTSLSSHIRSWRTCHCNWNQHPCHHTSEAEQYVIV